jgi:hypothetical protein
MSRSYTSSPPKRLHGVLWDSFSFIIYHYILDSVTTCYQLKAEITSLRKPANLGAMIIMVLAGGDSAVYNFFKRRHFFCGQ